jgi:AraC-like DNA-binding protein
MAELTVAASIVRGLIGVAASRGAKRQELLERSGIDPAELKDGDNRVPFPKYVALLRAGKKLANDPALALHFGETVDMSEMSVVGRISSDSGTMDEDVALLNRYSPLALEVEGGGERFHLERTAGQLWIVDTRQNPNEVPEITEMLFARAVCGIRRVLGETPMVKAVQVTHAAPEYRAEYDRIFRVPVTFNSDKNALLLCERAWWALRRKVASPYASGVFRVHAEALLERLNSSKSTRGRVERLLMAVLQTGEVKITTIARGLGLSRQTLFRKLRAEGVTFEAVVDEMRRKMALQYLTAERVSISETAYRVGFSGPSAFSRAFKRWTGSSPRTYLSQQALGRVTAPDERRHSRATRGSQL